MEAALALVGLLIFSLIMNWLYRKYQEYKEYKGFKLLNTMFKDELQLLNNLEQPSLRKQPRTSKELYTDVARHIILKIPPKEPKGTIGSILQETMERANIEILDLTKEVELSESDYDILYKYILTGNSDAPIPLDVQYITETILNVVKDNVFAFDTAGIDREVSTSWFLQCLQYCLEKLKQEKVK
jgi:hypothetical protein